jgi:hypothetical protein
LNLESVLYNYIKKKPCNDLRISSHFNATFVGQTTILKQPFPDSAYKLRLPPQPSTAITSTSPHPTDLEQITFHTNHAARLALQPLRLRLGNAFQIKRLLRWPIGKPIMPH